MDHDHNHDMSTTMATGTTTMPDGVCIPRMDMSLHWGTCEWILVRTWKADTTGKFVFAAVLICFATVAYEGLKFYREMLFYQTARNKVKFTKQNDGTLVKVQEKMTIKDQLFNWPHILQTFLHGLQIFISYMLMLIIMLCNLNLIISICVGAAVGYFFFAWLKKSTINDLNECCY
ncbi:hypothetical protein PVAND_001345 [Polypedilum vanderplanki]|uniref:Copper transport protein n=1 Tax=Polypedilum vanderplanki TaxID=319348 RepID=A0A9J6BNZ0_POLVA|nr:hypothetical protein PVAND_001345 [Polypedilum vanderplanki]